jgi:hypothetical protein
MSDAPEQRSRLGRWWWLIGLAIAALVVIILAPLASSDPDGLNRIAEDHGFMGAARDAVYHLIPGYEVPGLEGSVSKIAAGLIGVAVVFAIMLLLGRLLARRDKSGEGR